MYLGRIDTYNLDLNAIVSHDPEGASRSAAAADAARSRGETLGPLHGLPITIKDSYETTGLRSVCGRPDLAKYVPAVDAVAVSRLRDAGAIIVGKTNIPTGNQDVQASNPVFGRTNNPWDLSRTSGGSAGGRPAAAAAGLASIDYGSEIGGSTRIPANYCGLFGHKSTWQSVLLAGHIPSAPGIPGRWGEMDMACAGFQGRGARDIIAALDATVGPLNPEGGFTYTLAPPRATKLKDFRVAVWTDDSDCPIDDEVRRAVTETVAALRDSGANVVDHPPSIPVSLAECHALFLSLVFGAFSVDCSTMSVRSGTALAVPAFQHPRGEAAAAIRGTIQSHRDWLFRDSARREIADRWRCFSTEFDVLLLPVTPTIAPAHHNSDHDLFGRQIRVNGASRSYWDQTKWNAVANIGGTPATTMPVAANAANMPIGVQVTGPAGGDRTTVEFAALLTEVLGGYRIPSHLPMIFEKRTMTSLHVPLNLSCHLVLHNRILKVAFSEGLGNKPNAPEQLIERLQTAWSRGGSVADENLMIDGTQLGEPDKVVADDADHPGALSHWATTTKDAA